MPATVPVPASGNLLGEFLRARRAALGPRDIGLVSHGVRRVAGLRREEVADLAGVNADYDARLEQGRERNPSLQVLDALGRALRLAPGAPSAEALVQLAARTTGPLPGDAASSPEGPEALPHFSRGGGFCPFGISRVLPVQRPYRAASD